MLMFVVVLALVGGLLFAATRAAARAPAPTPRGQRVDIGGRALRVVAEGPEAAPGPAVVCEAGSFGFAADWASVQARLASQGVRSYAYDRAGLAFSDPGPPVRDSDAIAGDLIALLESLGLGQPVVLVSHSMAGLHARILLRRRPDLIAGLVLVDAATPEGSQDRRVVAFVRQFASASRATAALARAGMLRPFGFLLGDMIGLPAEARREKHWAFGHPAHNRWAAAEVALWEADAKDGLSTPLDPALPVAAVIAGAGRGSELDAVRTAPAEASQRGMVEFVPGANHATLLGERHADRIVAAIQHVRRALAS